MLRSEKCFSKIFVILLGLIIVGISVWSSLNFRPEKITELKDLYKILDPSLIYIVIFALKLLIGFWIMAILMGIFKPEKISEIGAKIFGLELSHKFSQETMNKVDSGLEKLQFQLDIITALNEAMLNYIATPFEDAILNSENKADKIRQIVKDILLTVYAELPKVKIDVLPLETDYINNLPEHIAAYVRLLIDEGLDVVQVPLKSVGIGIHHGTEGQATLIVINTREQNYEISLAEITCASNLFVAISTIIDWARKTN